MLETSEDEGDGDQPEAESTMTAASTVEQLVDLLLLATILTDAIRISVDSNTVKAAVARSIRKGSVVGMTVQGTMVGGTVGGNMFTLTETTLMKVSAQTEETKNGV